MELLMKFDHVVEKVAELEGSLCGPYDTLQEAIVDIWKPVDVWEFDAIERGLNRVFSRSFLRAEYIEHEDKIYVLTW